MRRVILRSQSRQQDYIKQRISRLVSIVAYRNILVFLRSMNTQKVFCGNNNYKDKGRYWKKDNESIKLDFEKSSSFIGTTSRYLYLWNYGHISQQTEPAMSHIHILWQERFPVMQKLKHIQYNPGTWNAEYLGFQLKCCVWNDSNCNLSYTCVSTKQKAASKMTGRLWIERGSWDWGINAAPTVVGWSWNKRVNSFQNSKLKEGPLLICGHWVTRPHFIYFFFVFSFFFNSPWTT